MKVRHVAEFGIIDAILLVWGIAYFVTVAARPHMYGNVSLLLSAGFLAVLGLLLIVSVFLDNAAIYFFMSMGYIYGFIISWTGTVTWNVPYDPGTAAVSMAAIDFFIASILMYKALRTSTYAAPAHHPHPKEETTR